MLIFNCTEAASSFFSRVHKGKKISPVDSSPPSSIVEDDGESAFVEQWLVHATTVQRSHVLFAIHIKTRYCMIFTDMKKADVTGFVARFAERWREGLMRDAINHDFIQWVDGGVMFERMEKSCSEQNFYRRSHRSAQKHLNEIVWFFEDKAVEQGCLPQGEYPAIGFDAWINNMVKSSKGQKDYFYPNEEMVAHWLRQYSGLDQAGIQGALARRKQADQEISAFQQQSGMH